ncbi:MAG: 2-hydroxyhepta-2,4-diene-1,7-dioate isomerase [gamma proteobacterium symbiont of Ctena orbiculata]|uniref:Fumarylacetoacetate hydrolase family protein n=1 Tax=Candidatus Thiodiazotropha taylori TaxID=2792791 RepID=A0A944MGZ5_9GAMM|nr:fumarylacetoacetate hydrolase family protein [Candidatus Thiodiazotropha taylori]PUB83891.1 MAG: 2-hydroxyhepta-2,4-diene-1,7-dioate isomerase [gamma proteobacterium symbiont of Ctena orbiculata]MBT2991272.1 fumarylacetoacetate hydrolase family protein [Candidatus Thiodiazotropha taylori]MBT2997700.1 fumarylacetoacetate hydrolase family protein [Candidatus Thiodiazotropha taylori]MBT3027534.1 fumarylacetoacetate hydrolase family protein [Candidatus Thiodiazotropha taylori]
MKQWVRYEYQGAKGFGTLTEDLITIYQGDMYNGAVATDQSVPLEAVKLLTPCEPTTMIALWNNFHSRAAKEGWSKPNHPLYFMKASTSFLPPGGTIRRPEAYDGPVVYEGELGIVIGRQCRNVSEDEADDFVFGYTCVNDVTARGLLREDPLFVHWTRAKSFDTFCAVGPVIATGLDAETLSVRTLVDGTELQNYPVTDMFFKPRQIVSRISHDMPLRPGDIIACGTSIGAGPMEQGCTVEVAIEGIGTLVNEFN